MATARDLIKRSLRRIHVLDADEEPTDAEANDALESLNEMLGLWAANKSYVYATQQNDHTWAANQQSRTIGSGGDFNTTRPVKIMDSTFFTDVSGNDYPLDLINDRTGYSTILNKDTATSIPTYLYYEPNYPLGVFYIWPAPTFNMTLHLHTWEAVTSLASLNTAVAFPDGYEAAVSLSLAEYIAGEFGVAVPPEVAMNARKARKIVKRLNTKEEYSVNEAAHLVPSRAYNIYAGE